MSHEYKQIYRRNLPHIQPPDSTLFVTFRLAGSIPQPVLRQWKAEKLWLDKESERIEKIVETKRSIEAKNQEQRLLQFSRRWFRKFEDILHKEAFGKVWLKDERIASIMTESLHYRDGKVYRLDAYCIMSNHVHIVIKPFLIADELQRQVKQPIRGYHSDYALPRIMQSLKGYTARQANAILELSGQFWEHESFDHVVRGDEEYARIVKYVLNNPVKARLVKHWQEWKWSYKRSSTASR